MGLTDDLQTGINPYKDRIKELIQFLLRYFKNPIDALKNLPEFDWYSLVFLIGGFAAITGFVGGVIAMKPIEAVVGIITMPITAGVSCLIVSGFLYYTFMFFYHKEYDFKKIFTISVLAALPFLVLFVLSSRVPPVSLIGFAASTLLLIVGLSENTDIPRKRIQQLAGSIFLIYFLFFVVNAIRDSSKTDQLKEQASPASFDILKKEYESQ